MILVFLAILKGINPFDKLNHDIGLKNLGFLTYKKDFQKSPKYIFSVSENNKEKLYSATTNIFEPKTLNFSVYYRVTDFTSSLSSPILFIPKKINLIPLRQVS